MFKISSWIIILAIGTVSLSGSNSINLLQSQDHDLQGQNSSLSINIPELPPLKEEFYLPPIPQENLLTYARSITVKVISGDSWGSGVIIEQKGSIYTVLTNDHVILDPEAQYQVETPDGKIYQASLVKGIDFKHYDLGLLQFQSINQKYNVAVLGDSSKVFEQEIVIATGFPFGANLSEDHGFKLTKGQITILLDKSIENGYQIGFTNPIQKGMSGGPVLNLQGEVIAINGLHAYPLWGESYKYDNGEQIPPQLQEKMDGSSWGIPINNFVQLADPFLSSAYQDINVCN